MSRSRRRLHRRYGRSTSGEKKTIHGGLLHVYPTAGKVVIADGAKEWDLRLMSPRYWASGSSAQAYNAALRVQKLVGRQVVAHIEYHSAFGWVIFGGSNIKLEK
jgi:hypothetical protein